MQTYLLPIHFEISDGKHEINSVTLNTFTEAYKEIFEEIFDAKIEIQIGLPDEGGWKTTLAICGIILNFVGIDNLSNLIRGRDSSDLFLAANQHIAEFITQKAENASVEYPRKYIEQKNKIYQQFQKDRCVTAFDLDKYPSIPRNNFNLYIKDLPDEKYLDCGEAEITVYSPVWKGKKRRSWKGKINIIEGNETAFDFDDDLTGKFWEKIRLNEISPTTGKDVMIVQLIKRPNNKPIYRVIRVLSYNGKEIDSPLSEEIIIRITRGKIEQSHNEIESNPQMDLFKSENF